MTAAEFAGIALGAVVPVVMVAYAAAWLVQLFRDVAR